MLASTLEVSVVTAVVPVLITGLGVMIWKSFTAARNNSLAHTRQLASLTYYLLGKEEDGAIPSVQGKLGQIEGRCDQLDRGQAEILHRLATSNGRTIAQIVEDTAVEAHE